MWQRFTEKTRRVIFFAQEEAAKLGERNVGTEHMPLGIVREDDCVAVRVLDRLGVSVVRVRQELGKYLARGDGRLGTDMMLTARSKRVIDYAYEEARRLNNDYVGTEHILLGLVREEDDAAGRVLTNLGVTLESARAEVEAIQDGAPTPPASRGLDRLPGRLLDLLDRWLPVAATDAARENSPLEDVLRAQFDAALRALQNLRPEAFADPASVRPAEREPEMPVIPVPEPETPRPAPIPLDRERAIFQVAIDMARRQGSEDMFRAMLQEALDGLDQPGE
jgi:ATP-dependent Clp protease ATP-binding subunit ClpA